jgi:hypothetical protein
MFSVQSPNNLSFSISLLCECVGEYVCVLGQAWEILVTLQ